MKVDLLRSTPEPERLVCQTARGDYSDEYIGDTEFDELMDPVKIRPWGEQYVLDRLDHDRWESIDDCPEGRERDELRRQAKTASLVQFVFKRGHFGPFEHPQATFAVEGVSRSCMAQITRHRHASFDVQSMRYADFSEKEAIIPESLRNPDHVARETGEVELSSADRKKYEVEYTLKAQELFDLYEEMVEVGVPKEDARFILPIGTPVNMSVTLNARGWMHVFDMRRKPDAQWEVREMSNRVFDEFRNWMPITGQLYEESAPHKLKP